MTEIQVLTAVAKAQGELYKWAKQTLVEDKTDGIRATKLMSKHNDFYSEMRDELVSYGFISGEEASECDKIAGLST